jgi:hypothetical protein
VPVTINKAKQVNIAADGGQQVNVQNMAGQEKKSTPSPPAQPQYLCTET